MLALWEKENDDKYQTDCYNLLDNSFYGQRGVIHPEGNKVKCYGC